MKITTPPWQKMSSNLKLGLRVRDEENWLPFEDIFDNPMARPHQLATKLALLKNCHNEVFAALPSADATSEEVLKMVEAHLQAYHPRCSKPQAQSLHPLEAAARLVPEDLLIIEPRRGHNNKPSHQPDWCLVAGALCFPAHWKLQEKMNKSLAVIHEPVPDYGEILASPVNRFFNNMSIGPISARMNWSLQFGDTLFTPVRSHTENQAKSLASNQIYVRVENQTLRKLPKTGHVLFTIRTHLVPITKWRNTEGAIEDLLCLLKNMSGQMRHYKGADIYEASLQKMMTDKLNRV